MSFSRLLAVLFLALPFTSSLAAQPLPLTVDVPLPGVSAYSEAIPAPPDVIGHRIGASHTMPHQVVEYFEAVAEASDRVVFGEHGRTFEGRKLVHAIVTSPANHARLEQIRQQNLRLVEDAMSIDDAELAQMPGVVYMGYSVHGNEASGTEAAILLLYHLAAGQGTAVEEVLDNLVVVIDPMLNPDGRDRFTDWVNRNRGGVANADPQDREHNEAWPGGRTNHYFFDLNRDWMTLQLLESQGRMDLWQRWRPQVSTDFHEMGSDGTFFFQPGIPSRTNPNTPPANQALTAEIGTYHARALDRIGQLYYTEESFDDYYYGKGSTYPDVNGAVGILFEQASSRALERDTDFGLLEYGATVRNQFATSLSTLEAAVAMREKLLRNMRDFYRSAPERAAASPVEGYVIGLERGRTRAQLLVQLFQKHGIRVHALAREVESNNNTYRPGSAYLIPLDQPQVSLITAFMERPSTFPDSLFYDVSAWTLPLAFDVDHAELRRDVDRLKGEVLGPIETDGGGVVGGRADFAYLIEWGPYFAPRALYRLMEAGVRPLLMHAPIEAVVGGQARTFRRGSVVIPLSQKEVDAETIHGLAARIAAEDHVPVYAVTTGLTPAGPDLGGESTSVLPKPAVLLVSGPGTNGYDVGEAWYLLTERHRIPVSLIDQEFLDEVDLNRYNTMILAGGSYSDVPVEEVKQWVQRGGRLITLANGIEWAVRNGLAELEKRTVDLDSLVQDVPYADLATARGAHFLGGAIFEARLDTTHPLAYGFDERLPVFRSRNSAYAPSTQPGTNVAVLTAAPRLSGYVSGAVLDQLAGSAAVVARRFGRGRVIHLDFDPDFRAFWYGTDGLLLNAVLFGGAF